MFASLLTRRRWTMTTRAEALVQIKSTDTESDWVAATQTLADTTPSDGGAKGSCVYVVAGWPEKGCVDNVSKAECIALAGKWSTTPRFAGQLGVHKVTQSPTV